MFSFNTFIDAANRQQKDLVKIMIRDEDTAESVAKSLDAQAEMARSVNQVAVDLSAKFAAEAGKLMSEILRYDYADAAQRMAKTWVPAAK